MHRHRSQAVSEVSQRTRQRMVRELREQVAHELQQVDNVVGEREDGVAQPNGRPADAADDGEFGDPAHDLPVLAEELVLNEHNEGSSGEEAVGSGSEEEEDSGEERSEVEDNIVDVGDGEQVLDNHGIFDNNDNDRDDRDNDDVDDENGDDENHGNDNDIDFEVYGNRPLYRDATLTVKESVAAILTLMLNHNLSASCIEDVLALIQLHCPSNGYVNLSLYKLEKYFKFSAGPMNKKYYCSVCLQGLATHDAVCPVCERRRRVSYFIQVPLVPQLEKMYERPDFFNSLQQRYNRREGFLEDIYDGQLYKDQVTHGILADPNNFSMTFYTDGVPVFKAKNYSFWGFLLSINELPYKERIKRENTLLAGLWFGTRKPDANQFMLSFMDDLQRLYRGVHLHAGQFGRRIFVRGYLIAGVADIPAKSSFLNCVHHNGYFGCNSCEISGVEEILPTGSTTHAFPYTDGVQKRTLQRMLAQAREATANRGNDPDFNIMGVKGPTALRLFMPNFVRGAAIDPMHMMAGIVKKLLELHFDSKHSGEGFSLRVVIDLVDEMLLAMKPPKFIHRLPQKVSDVCHWKASELKTWLFYYSIPIYKQVMRPVYFNNYLKLVIGLSYLSADSIPLAQVAIADQLLHEFVREFQDLYGLRFCTMNVHLLLHLADCVREIGPTWIYTCYPYEDLNGQMLRNIHGKTNVDTQLARMHWQHLELPMKLQSLRDGPVKDYCMSRKKKLKLGERLCRSCYVVGAYSAWRNGNDPIAVDALHRANIRFVHLRSYSRLLKDGLLYVARNYTRDLRSTSSYIAYNADNVVHYGNVISFVKVMQCDCNFVCACGGQHFAIVRGIEKESDFHPLNRHGVNLKYLFECRMSLIIHAVPVRNLKTVCFSLPVNNQNYLASPINSKEVE